MGARIGCARCHGHPSENWTLDDDLGLAAFFAKVSFKATLEWKEEIVYFNPQGGPLAPEDAGSWSSRSSWAGRPSSCRRRKTRG